MKTNHPSIDSFRRRTRPPFEMAGQVRRLNGRSFYGWPFLLEAS